MPVTSGIPVMISDCPAADNVTSMTFQLNYNAADLNVQSVSMAYPNWEIDSASTSTPGQIIITCSSDSGTGAIAATTPTTLLNITATVPETGNIDRRIRSPAVRAGGHVE